MAARDRGLERVRAAARAAQGLDAPVDQQPVPPGPVLVGEQHRVSVGAGAGGRPGRLELQQRGEAVDFGLRRHQRGQDTGQAQGVLAQGGAQEVLAGGGRVALVEDEVDDLQDRAEPGLAVGAVGHLEGHPGRGQRPLGPHDALRDRGLGREEGAGDLGGGQPAHQAQGEGDPGLGGEDGVAGGEDQAQQVVVDVLGVRRFGGRRRVLEAAADLREFARVGLPAAHEVDGAVSGGGHEPGARPVGDAGSRPLLQRGDQGVLGEFLGDADVPHDAGDTGDDPRGLDPEHRFDRLGRTHCRHGHSSEQP
ncbi:hypothetical protein AMK16_21330 [Streptomyces sp. CB00455]|nr:hypothetical protein AMK16_21330 [Streptomyces sp. CB00455]